MNIHMIVVLRTEQDRHVAGQFMYAAHTHREIPYGNMKILVTDNARAESDAEIFTSNTKEAIAAIKEHKIKLVAEDKAARLCVSLITRDCTHDRLYATLEAEGIHAHRIHPSHPMTMPVTFTTPQPSICTPSRPHVRTFSGFRHFVGDLLGL